MGVMEKFRAKAGTWRVIAVSGTVYVISQAIIGSILHVLGPEKVLRMQTSISDTVVRETFAEWRQAGLLGRYASHYWLDFPHGVWYGLFLSSLLTHLFDRNGISERYNFLLAVPFVAAACDIVENLCHLSFLANEANITPALVAVSGTSSILKWSLAGLSVIAIGILVARSLLHRQEATA